MLFVLSCCARVSRPRTIRLCSVLPTGTHWHQHVAARHSVSRPTILAVLLSRMRATRGPITLNKKSEQVI